MANRKSDRLFPTHSLPTIQDRLSVANDIYGPRPKTARPRTARPKTSKPRSRTRRVQSERRLSMPDEPIIFEIPLLAPSPKLLSIRDIHIGETSTEVKMTPDWFQPDDQHALQGIEYPADMTDRRPFDSVARYRTKINRTKNYKRKALCIGSNATETVIIALDKFVQQFGGDLTFTNKEISFTQTAHRTACGIANLDSTHLLATNHIPSAKNVFKTKIDYEKDLAESADTMKNFILSFSTAIAEILRCENDYVRVSSVEKNDDDEGKAKVDFGITTPDQIQTEILAKDLEEHARSGFDNNAVLKYIKVDKYQYKLTPILTYLQLQPKDFCTEYNFDYNIQGLCAVNRRGRHPYYVPLGWYRHALDISKKYPGDDRWLGCKNIEGEWPVAFHGTHAEVASDITNYGLSIDKVQHDLMREEAVQKIGSKADSPGLYVETRCKGGAHPNYTKTFSVPVSEKRTERFRVVFQCRVKPGEFTTHISPITGVETWRVVDPSAVRPYGILLRRRKPPKKEGDDSESEDDLYK